MGAPSSEMLRGRRLLVVDDSAVNLELAQYELEEAGAIVTVARNGLEAVELVRASPAGFDAVLMDIQMPELDGPDAARMIRGSLGLRELPMIALTASDLSSERELALQAGMDGVIAKPLELQALIQVLGGWWSSSQASEVWPVIAGLDPVNTKLRFGADRSLFTWALRRVCHENADLENSVLPLSGIALLKRLHKLCGSAGAIGATALSDAARDAHAVLEQDELAGTRIVVDRVGPEIRRLRESAAAYWTQPPSSAIGHTVPVDSEAYDELASLLARHSIDAISAFARVAPGLRAQLGPEDFAVLERAIDALDYDGALELLHATVLPQCARADR